MPHVIIQTCCEGLALKYQLGNWVEQTHLQGGRGRAGSCRHIDILQGCSKTPIAKESGLDLYGDPKTFCSLF